MAQQQLGPISASPLMKKCMISLEHDFSSTRLLQHFTMFLSLVAVPCAQKHARTINKSIPYFRAILPKPSVTFTSLLLKLFSLFIEPKSLQWLIQENKGSFYDCNCTAHWMQWNMERKQTTFSLFVLNSPINSLLLTVTNSKKTNKVLLIYIFFHEKKKKTFWMVVQNKISISENLI